MHDLPELPSDLDWHALDRYVAGESSPDEHARVDAMVTSVPQWRAVLAGLRASVDEATSPAAAQVVVGVMRRLHAESQSAVALPAIRTQRTVMRHRLSSTAASRARFSWMIGALACVGFVIASTITVHRHHSAFSPITQLYRTGIGERATITLADRTTMTIGPSTTLRTDGRMVVLDGEAFFHVSTQTTTPFVVCTRGITTHVLGTEFNIEAYTDASRVRVTVATGKVMVHPSTTDVASGVVLNSGDRVEWMGNTLSVQHRVDIDQATDWMRGSLVFDDTPLTDVLAVLRRTYGLDATLADTTLGQRRLTATIHATRTNEILEYIAIPLHLRTTWRGHQVVLSSL